MKKVVITGVLSLFMGSILYAAGTTFNTDYSVKTAKLELVMLPEVSETTAQSMAIHGPYHDERGQYYIVSNESSCWKLYVNESSEEEVKAN